MAVRIETEKDIEQLRQVALLQQAELDRLHRRLVELTGELAQARGEDATRVLQLELATLKEQLDARTRALFGPSSERRGRPEAEKAAEKASTQARRGHGPRAQPELPVVEKVHTLDGPDRICPKCGGDLEEMAGQYEEADEVDVVRRSFQIVRHKRQKYTCRCGECVDTALGAPKLIAGGRYSIEFAIEVAEAKYLDHGALARQERQMRRQGLDITRQALWDQLFALYRHLAPTADALHAYVVSSDLILGDETRWPLLGRDDASRWHAWGVAREDAISYRILGSRGLKSAREVLAGFQGTLVVDGYAVYEAVQKSRAGPEIELAHCWSHTRRKYREAEPHHPRAGAMLDMIGQLYAIEARARETDAEERLAVLGELRRTESRPIVDDICRWVTTEHALPKSSLGKALAYTERLWPGLVRFLDDARIPLDTNQLERGMRALALGRANHHGSRSERGTQVAALFYSLFETAKLVGVEPRQYLAEATHRAIANPGTVTLPHELVTS